MIDLQRPLYSLTVGEFVELLKNTVSETKLPTTNGEAEKNGEEEYLTVKELTEMLGCTDVTIYNHMKKGRLPRPLKLGRKSVWDKAELLEFLRTPVNRRRVKM